MTSTELTAAQQEVLDLLEASGGDVTAAFATLVARAESQGKVKRKSSAARKADHVAAITSFDLDYLIDIQDRASGLIDKVTANELQLGMTEVTPELAKAWAIEFKDAVTLKEFIEARREQMKQAIFDYFTAQAKAKGVPNPEHQNGVLEVPELGVQFERYGAGLKTPTINLETLKGLLPPEIYAQVVTTVHVAEKVIPAHTETSFDRDAAVVLSQAHPEILLAVQGSLESDGWKTESFTLRNTPERKPTS